MADLFSQAHILERLRNASILRESKWPGAYAITPSYRGNELGGECGEAQNIIKKLERERLGIAGSRSTPDALGEELADIIICCDLIAQDYDIDLWTEIVKKFNKTSKKVGIDVLLEY